MCRSIKQLRQPDQPPTEEELRAAALQYVRKVSGYRTPSRLNQAVFDQAVDEVAAATKKLLDRLTVKSPKSPSGNDTGHQSATAQAVS